jgi:hypothetical protein
LTLLAQAEFTPELPPWAEGARAWRPAQNDRHQRTLDLARRTLREVEDVARFALQELVNMLNASKKLEKYRE